MLRTPLFLASCMAACLSQAQTPMLDATVRWDETGGYAGFISGHMTYSYFPQGDTLINGLTYYKIERTGVDSTYMMIAQPPYSQFMGTNSLDQYMGAVREDVVARKWYVVFDGQAAEQLLFDFDLSVGSMITGTFGNCQNAPVVSSIDQVTIGGQARNRYHLQTGLNRYLIEGIGINTGLFGQYCQAIEAGYCLEVFHHGADSLIVDGCGQIPTAVNTVEPADGVLIGPNPVLERLVVDFHGTRSAACIIDAVGRVCGSATLNTGRNELVLNGLATGSYALRLERGGMLRFLKE